MRGLHKSKRVTWASDVNLCQVRLFLSEEAPSEVGLGAQDHLQAKTSLHCTGVGTDDSLPPGFEAASPYNQLHTKLSEIPPFRWKCPPRFVLADAWRVVAGEESNEAEAQNKREMRVLEAIYPRPNAIPQNPANSSEAEGFQPNDQQIPLVPITPIEDEELSADASDAVAPFGIPISSQPPQFASGIPYRSHSTMANNPHLPANDNSVAGVLHGTEPDVAAAASAAFAAIMKSTERGNMIDQDLLIKILNDRQMIERLVAEYGSSSAMQSTPSTRSASMPLSEASRISNPETRTSSISSSSSSSESVYSHLNGVRATSIPNPQLSSPIVAPVFHPPPTVRPPPAKDINYYKSLIQQHGGERQESLPPYSGNPGQIGMNPELGCNPKLRDAKGKIMKPCMYFNSARGCRNGANCAYQHDSSLPPRSSSTTDVQSAKRVKLDREITGT